MVIRRRLKVGDPITIGNNWAQECGEAAIESHSLHGDPDDIDFGEQAGDRFVAYEIVPKRVGVIKLAHHVTFTDGRSGERHYELEVHA